MPGVLISKVKTIAVPAKGCQTHDQSGEIVFLLPGISGPAIRPGNCGSFFGAESLKVTFKNQSELRTLMRGDFHDKSSNR
jgi:hypothetical protein